MLCATTMDMNMLTTAVTLAENFNRVILHIPTARRQIRQRALKSIVYPLK